MSEPPKLVLRKASQGAIAARHPWVLASSIDAIPTSITDSQVVDLVQSDGRFLARGLYNPHSRIRVRVYAWKDSIQLDDSFFLRRLDRALELRRRLSLGIQQEAQRLVFSEADQLSGLIVDRYADWIVVQQTAKVMSSFLPVLTHRLVELYQPQGILLRIDPKTAQAEGMEAADRVLFGSIPSHPIEIMENELKWHVDLSGGQKTGYYLDQRLNRREAARWVAPGDRVLDVCCYLGGFGLTIARWSQASRITAIDTSEKAISAARNHAELNGLESKMEFEVNDFYRALEDRIRGSQFFDTLVLDPPRMAGNRSQLDAALRAYHRLNYLGVQLLKPGGILITCSCSGRVTRLDFHHMLLGVAKRSGREIQILAQHGAAPDHPTIATCPETDYLKCFVCRIL